MAIKLAPNYAHPYELRGLLKYNQLKDLPSGIKDIQQAAKLYQRQGDLESAQRAIDYLKKWGVVTGI